ncbi:putative polysaccharide biosynthesis protein [Thalassobacillus pellis]|uniref:putative polysaccharide biosynthesis protein n=1 Tax=Thalassobacillus pellis TaxID=748008 RepID=UPI001961B620|nr:polysaccharide biosynthesis protein [Thalassobacillus pellis]MBM7554907.1 PST family polysaccharide transporter [Thalassobacillus pellis]
MSKIIKGTMLLTGATFLSKMLGLLYVIPFEALVGASGGALYAYAYVPYNIFLSVSTLGVPLAVSKFVSKYNSLGDYKTGRDILKSGMQLMALTGLIAFLFMFFGAGQVAHWTISEGAQSKNSIEDVTMVIRMVSFALLIIPSMSIVRGFFQGHQSMAPTAVSQVIEQIFRIVFLLTAVFLVTRVFGGSTQLAVGFATFSAFIGAIASCIVLFLYWKKRKPYLDKELESQTSSHRLSKASMFKELFSYAGPFVLVGIATSLYQIVDQFTFNDAMFATGLGSKAEQAYAAINLYGHKLVIIPVTLATGLSLALMPAITRSFTEKNKKQLHKQINQALQIIMLLILPAVVGLSLLSDAAYGSFYGIDENIGYYGKLLAWYAPVALLYALFTVSAAILQGINQQNFTFISLTCGLIVKGSLNIPFIMMFGAIGSIVVTGLAVGTAVVMNLMRARRKASLSFKPLFKRTLLIIILTTIMSVIVLFIRWAIGGILSPEENRIHALIVLLAGIAFGGISYLWLSYKTTLLEHIMGGRIRLLDRFLKRS